VGRGKSDRTFNYLTGDVANHREGVGAFDSIWYENLYPGRKSRIEGPAHRHQIQLPRRARRRLRAIRVKYDGVDGLSLRPDGALDIHIAEGWDALADGAPQIYQEINGEKKTVAGKFSLLDGHTYGIEVTGAYDATLPLVIDPDVAWGTYLGQHRLG